MLTFLKNDYYKKYERNERGTNFFISFLFLVLFFFLINHTSTPNDRYTIIINTFLLMIWYGLTITLL